MTVYRLRVSIHPNSPLFAATEPVWRDIELDDSHTLEAFHEVIFDAFDRFDQHLYEFTTINEHGHPERTYVDPTSYDGSPSWRAKEADEIERMLDELAPDDAPEKVKESFREAHADPPTEGNAAETEIAELDLSEGDVLQYLFDFGDSWDHHVEVRETRDRSVDGSPTVVERHGDAPPQYPDPEEL